MEATARAVERLTEEHSEVIDGAVGQSGPLLEELRLARYPSYGKSVGGAGDRMMLNIEAFTLYENIDGVVRSWLSHFREHHTGDLIPLTKRLYEVLQAEHAGARLEDSDRMFSMFTIWVHQIGECFDPPRMFELTVACPDCGERHVETVAEEKRNGKIVEVVTRHSAVRAVVRAGYAVTAECHSCGKLWIGRDSLTKLAEQMGVEVDWVKLREAVGDTQT